MRKIIGRVVAVGLAATMMLSLAACGSKKEAESVEDAVVSSSTSEEAVSDDVSTDTLESTDIEDETNEDVADSDLQVSWIESHSSDDFKLSDLYAVNSVTNLAPAGSGKALKVRYIRYEQQVTDNGIKISEDPWYVADFYQWFDEKGNLNWLRDIVSSSSDTEIYNSWNYVDLSDGFGYSTVYSNDGKLISRNIYTNTDNLMAVCDTFFPLYTFDNSSSPMNFDADMYVEDGDEYADQKRASTWELPMNDSEGTGYSAYLSDDMKVQLIELDSMWGLTEVIIPEIIDIADVPATPDTDASTIMCDMSINGTDYEVPMLKDAGNAIFTASDTDYAVNEKITTDKAVTVLDKEGNPSGETTNIVNSENELMKFTLSDAVAFDVTYEYPAADDESSDASNTNSNETSSTDAEAE